MAILREKIAKVLQGLQAGTSLSQINKVLRREFQNSKQIDSIQARIKDSSHLNIIIKKNGATMALSSVLK
jgi:hypothetical protein